METTENSVVVALREVRRLERERRGRAESEGLRQRAERLRGEALLEASAPPAQHQPWQVPQSLAPAPAPRPRVVRAILLTAAVCASIAGYAWRTNDRALHAKMTMVETERQQAQEARAAASEERQRVEQELKGQLASLETQLAEARAKVAFAEKAAADERSKVARKPAVAKSGPVRPARRPEANAGRAFVAPKVNKRKLTDDPLSGLKVPGKSM